MADLTALMAQMQNIQNRGVDMIDPAGAMLAAHTALITALVSAVSALQGAAPAAESEQAAPAALTQAQVQEMVAEAVAAAFGKLESAVSPSAAEAQPTVAQNTGSGAAPVDPVTPGTTPAAGSASLTPDAAGTAPQTPPQA